MNNMNANHLIFLLSFSLIFFSGATAQELTLPRLSPTDESDRDSQLKTYLGQLRIVVQKRDGPALQKLIASDILLTFGPPPNKLTEETLELMNPNSPVWRELEDVLQFGGTFLGTNHFCMPYVFTKFPENIDSYTHQVVIKPSVIARSKPSGKAPKVTTLEFAIVRTDPGIPEIVTGTDRTRWIIIYLDEQIAYIPEGTLRSPIDTRACFEKRRTGWVMTHLVGGD